jgi:hypothetical protein
MWPDEPDLERGYCPWRQSGWVNAQGIFAWGLAHDQAHHAQIGRILDQARSAGAIDQKRQPPVGVGI